MAKPGGDPGANDIGPAGDGIGRRGGDPVQHQCPCQDTRRIGAKCPQVTDPGKGVRAAQQGVSARQLGPVTRPQRQHSAAEFQLALQQPRAKIDVTRPGIPHRQCRSIGNPAEHLQWQAGDCQTRASQQAGSTHVSVPGRNALIAAARSDAPNTDVPAIKVSAPAARASAAVAGLMPPSTASAMG